MASARWINVSDREPCTVCGKPDWCRRSPEGDAHDCYRECGVGGVERRDKLGQVYWRHYTGGKPAATASDHGGGVAAELQEEHPDLAYEHERADPDTLHAVYSDLVALLPLYEHHGRAIVQQRGISVAEAHRLGWRSFPTGLDAREVVEKLEAKYGYENLLTVPGFDRPRRDALLADGTVLNTTELRLSGAPGVLLPQRDSKGRIVGMMLRLDDPAQPDPKKKPRRYLPLISYTTTGCAAKIGVHVPLHENDEHAPKIVRIVEGIIKADISTLRTGILTIGIPNGGRWLQGVARAEALGAEAALLAPDADTRTNQGICATLVHTANDLAAKGSVFAIETWPPEAGKGLDDVLHAGRHVDVEVHGGVAMWQSLKAWAASSGAPRDLKTDARILLDGVIEKAAADPTYVFRPNIAEAVGLLDEGSVEVQRIFTALRPLLKHAGWNDFLKKVNVARGKRDSAARKAKAHEVEARGGHAFKLGDQAEARRKLLDDLTPVGTTGFDNTLCVFDRGALFKYGGGIYDKLDEAALITRVADYSGSPIAGGGVLRVSSGFTKGTVELTYATCAKPGFFNDAPIGAAFRNGFVLVDLRAKTVKLMPNSRDHRVRVRYEFDYAPGGKPKKFLAALERYFRNEPDKVERIACIQEFIGASLTGAVTHYQRAMILRGVGNDGKSKLAEIIIAAMPTGSVANVAPQKFSNDYSRASLDGKLLNVVFETPEGEVVDSSALKALVVGDAIEARNPYERPFTLRSRAGHIYICNLVFRTKDVEQAFRRRWILMIFNEPLVGDEINANFAAEVIREEIPSIVSWAIEGLARLVAKGSYTLPKSSEAAIDEWLDESDTVAQFMDDRLVVLTGAERADEHGWFSATPLYAEYRTWARDHGHIPMSSSTFGRRLKAKLGLKRKETKKGKGICYPVRLKELQDPVAERMKQNGEKITREDLEPKPITPSAALTGTAAVAAGLTVTPAVRRLHLVHPAPEPEPAPAAENDDREDDDDECRARGMWALRAEEGV